MKIHQYSSDVLALYKIKLSFTTSRQNDEYVNKNGSFNLRRESRANIFKNWNESINQLWKMFCFN